MDIVFFKGNAGTEKYDIWNEIFTRGFNMLEIVEESSSELNSDQLKIISSEEERFFLNGHFFVSSDYSKNTLFPTLYT